MRFDFSFVVEADSLVYQGVRKQHRIYGECDYDSAAMARLYIDGLVLDVMSKNARRAPLLTSLEIVPELRIVPCAH